MIAQDNGKAAQAVRFMDETGEQDKRQPGALQPPGASPHPRPSPFAKSSQKSGACLVVRPADHSALERRSFWARSVLDKSKTARTKPPANARRRSLSRA